MIPWTIDHPIDILCPWDSPGKNTGVGSHSLLQGIFLTQGWKLGLPHCRSGCTHSRDWLWRKARKDEGRCFTVGQTWSCVFCMYIISFNLIKQYISSKICLRISISQEKTGTFFPLALVSLRVPLVTLR